jgi:predicted site-specific integrase-resolvase
VAISETESKDDLLQDMTDVLTSLCARLYEQRGAANHAKCALKLVLSQTEGAMEQA